MAGTLGWRSPFLANPGDALTAAILRSITADLEDKFNGKISSADLYTPGGVLQVGADLDLQGHDLLNASNVATGIVNVKSQGVLGNGSGEGATIQAALQAIAGRGYSAAYFQSGTYGIDLPIQVPAGLALIGTPSAVLQIQSGGSVNFSGSDAYAEGLTIQSLVAQAQSGLIVQGGTFRGSALTFLQCAAGADLNGCSSAHLRACFFVSCTTGLRAVNCQNVSAVGLSVPAGGTGPMAYGVYLSNCIGVQIAGNFLEIRRGDVGNSAAVYVEGSQGVFVTGLMLFNQGPGVLARSCDGLKVVGAVCKDNNYQDTLQTSTVPVMPGIAVRSCTDSLVTGCTSVSTGSTSLQSYGLEVTGGSGNVAAGNFLKGNSGTTGIYDGSADRADPALCLSVDSGCKEYGNFEIRFP